MLTATRYRLYPTPVQAQALAFQFDAVRRVYNDTLDLRKAAWRERGERIGLRQTLDRLTPSAITGVDLPGLRRRPRP